MYRVLFLFPILSLLTGCLTTSAYQTYAGDPLPSMQVSIVEGAQFRRQDWINRYIDSVRFSMVDDMTIIDSGGNNAVEVRPGFHDVTVYFYWDLGSARGLAPALVSYASTREALSRTLRFNARAGESYEVRAQPVFSEGRRDITNLSYVDFWIIDQAGNEIVSREEGRYIPDR
jgi:hypothetical protein